MGSASSVPDFLLGGEIQLSLRKPSILNLRDLIEGEGEREVGLIEVYLSVRQRAF